MNTRDIELARQAGLYLAADVNWMPIIGLNYAEKLIALIRADERETCARGEHMTDRELLELAAKAAGWLWWRSKHGYWNTVSPEGVNRECCTNWQKFDSTTGEKLPEPTPFDALLECDWNPLTDDGDALRLSVKLNLNVYVVDGCSGAQALHVVFCSEPHACDPYAATRRAIVRAAAEIGRAMP
jgi:hypothetical protein